MWSLQSPKMKHFSTLKQGSRKRFDYDRRHEFLNKIDVIHLIDNVYINPCHHPRRAHKNHQPMKQVHINIAFTMAAK